MFSEKSKKILTNEIILINNYHFNQFFTLYIYYFTGYFFFTNVERIQKMNITILINMRYEIRKKLTLNVNRLWIL